MNRKNLFSVILSMTHTIGHYISLKGTLDHPSSFAFKNVIRRDFVVDFFSEPLDLAVKIATAIGRYLLSNQTLLAVPASNNQERKQREDLISLLEARKDGVLAALNSNTDNQNYVLFLHARNIEAIRKGELLLSHLLTSDIHSLLRPFESGSFAVSYEQRILPHGLSRSEPKAPPEEPRPKAEYRYVEEYLDASRPLRPDALRASAAGAKIINSNSWREQLLSNWLEQVLSRLQAALVEQRRIAALEREADERGVLRARLRPGKKVACPHCDGRFETSAKVEMRVRCPECRTHIDLVQQLAPTEYEGHQMLDGICTKCGCSITAVRHFKFKCSSVID